MAAPNLSACTASLPRLHAHHNCTRSVQNLHRYYGLAPGRSRYSHNLSSSASSRSRENLSKLKQPQVTRVTRPPPPSKIRKCPKSIFLFLSWPVGQYRFCASPAKLRGEFGIPTYGCDLAYLLAGTRLDAAPRKTHSETVPAKRGSHSIRLVVPKF